MLRAKESNVRINCSNNNVLNDYIGERFVSVEVNPSLTKYFIEEYTHTTTDTCSYTTTIGIVTFLSSNAICQPLLFFWSR